MGVEVEEIGKGRVGLHKWKGIAAEGRSHVPPWVFFLFFLFNVAMYIAWNLGRKL